MHTEAFLAQVESFMRAIDPHAAPDHAACASCLNRKAASAGAKCSSISCFCLSRIRHDACCSIVALAPLRAGASRARKALKTTSRWCCKPYANCIATIPRQSVFRYAWDDVEIDGCRIRRGERVMPLSAARNRDKVFAAPDEVRFEREAGCSLTFGAGAHSCMGLVRRAGCTGGAIAR